MWLLHTLVVTVCTCMLFSLQIVESTTAELRVLQVSCISRQWSISKLDQKQGTVLGSAVSMCTYSYMLKFSADLWASKSQLVITPHLMCQDQCSHLGVVASPSSRKVGNELGGDSYCPLRAPVPVCHFCPHTHTHTPPPPPPRGAASPPR